MKQTRATKIDSVLGFLPIVIFLSAMWLLSCLPSQKTKTEQRNNKDSLHIASLEQQLESLRKDTANYLMRLRESEYEEVTFDISCDSAIIERIISSGCPPSLVDSFVKAMRQKENVIRRLADGTVEYKGQISKYQRTNQTLLEENLMLKSEVSELRKQVSTTTTKTTDKSVTETKEKKGMHPLLIGAILFFCLLCLIIGLALGRKLKFLKL